VSLLANTADYLEREGGKKALALSEVQKRAEGPPATNVASSSRTSDGCDGRDGFSLLVTMDGDAYSQLPPHTKPVLQNWLPIVGTLRSSTDEGACAATSMNGKNMGWDLKLRRDGWHLPRSASGGPTTCEGAASCTIEPCEESEGGMPEVLWSL